MSTLKSGTQVSISSQAVGRATGGLMAGRNAVPLAVPLPFLLTGVGAAALFGLFLPVVLPEAIQAPDFPHVLALVHLATLGWLTMIVMGASLQLTPVITVAPLLATRFIRWLYPLYAGGVILLLSGFWWMRPWLIATGGCLIVLAVIHYVLILSMSLARTATRPLTTWFLVASLSALCIVVSLGLTMAFNLQADFLSMWLEQVLLIHLMLGVVGWLSNTLIGVSYTLVRMFALAHGHDDRWGRCVFGFVNGGLVILALAFIGSSWPLMGVGSGALVIAAWLFAYDFLRMVRMRRRRILDITQYHSIASVAYFAVAMPLTLVVLLVGWQQPTLLAASGLALLAGWLGQSTIGYLYKIVPFLVWQKRYGPLVGRQKVPLMRELLHERLARASWWLINVGLVCTICSILLAWVLPAQIAGGLLGTGFVLAAINIYGAACHLRRGCSR